MTGRPGGHPSGRQGRGQARGPRRPRRAATSPRGGSVLGGGGWRGWRRGGRTLVSRAGGSVVPALWPSVLGSSGREGRQGSRRLILSMGRARPHQEAGPREAPPPPHSDPQPLGIHSSAQAGRHISPSRAGCEERAQGLCSGLRRRLGSGARIRGKQRAPRGAFHQDRPTKTKPPAAEALCIHVWRPRRPGGLSVGGGAEESLRGWKGRAAPGGGPRSQLVPQWGN